MHKILKGTAVTLLTLAPALTAAQPATCPDAAAVFANAEAGPDAITLDQLAALVGKAETDAADLRPIANTIQHDFPTANSAEIADLMVVSYCKYLQDDAPENRWSEQNVTAFQEQVYSAVFNGPAPADYEQHSWLFGN